jgi:PiT family inorganic phosphate transporter
MTLAILVILGAAVLAFANGANDVSKGVATLAGSGRTTYRSAIAWGTWWTLAGGLASLVVSVELVEVFTSAIVAPDVLALATFPLAVSTGAIVGAGVRQGGDAVEWSRVGSLLMAWIVTLPIAAAAAAGVTWLWIVR